MAARTIFSRRYFLAALGALGMTTNITAATAQTDNPGLQLAAGTGTPETLAFDGVEALDARLTLPEGWLLTPDDSADDAFAPAEIFASMTRRFLCYDPQNRDRCEIEIYAARILPEWVGLASSYAQILARLWGPKKHGTLPHNPDFGEVLTGGDWRGVAALTRISVWRRGEWLLISRARYRSENGDQYQPLLAGIVGSLRFRMADFVDPITAALIADPLDMEDGRIVTMRPEWWRDPGFATPPVEQGQFKFWVDEADPQRNSGAMIAAQRVPALPDTMSAPPEDRMAAQAAESLHFLLINLLPGQTVTQTNTAAFTLGRTEHAVFDRTYVYKLDFAESGLVGIAQVTLTLTRDGRLVVSVIVTRAPLALDEVAPHLHATWFENQINTAVATFLAERSPFS